MGLDIDLNLSLEECQQEIDDQHDLDNLNDDECPKNLEPYNGMQFVSQDDAHSFYLTYAESMGFGILIKSSRRSRISRELIDVRYVCSRYGVKRSTVVSSRSNSKVDCRAMLHVKRDSSNGKWYVNNFIKDHNHELCPTHEHILPCNRSISTSSNDSIDTSHAVGESTSEINANMANKHRGCENIGYLEKVRDDLDKERGLALASGDAKAILLEHFQHMQEKDPNFFYAMDLDEEQRLKSVFWADGKSREDYKIFGDVVSFDTTYIANKYKVPFAPFIGVNNHLQSTLFGGALLLDETTSTFVWLMETWVRAMGGKPPIAILTDQEKAIKEAVSIVFPNTQHRFCLWYILRKIPEKLGHVMRSNENFVRIFNDCIYNAWLEDDFEKKWWNMIQKFDLEGNEWLETLFEERRFWVPTYVRDTFLSGMSTTQSINSFFDEYVNKKTSLKEFVEQYEAALRDKEEREAHANFNAWHKKPILKSPSPFEKQMSMIYTHKVLKRFQVEVLGTLACFPRSEGDVGAMKAFKVEDVEHHFNFMVTWDESRRDARCSCRLFECYGFLCRHVLCVFQFLGIFNIPSRFILNRWTKDVRSMSHISSKKQRFDGLLHEATKLCDEASSSQESFIVGYNAIKEALERCASVNRSLNLPKESQSGLHEFQDEVNVDGNLSHDISLLDQQMSKTKGAPKRMKRGIERNDGEKLTNNSKKVQTIAQSSISSTENSSQGKRQQELLSTSPYQNSQHDNFDSTVERPQNDFSERNTF